MAAKRRTPKRTASSTTTTPKKYRQVIEGEVTADDNDGIVLWDYIPDVQSKQPAHGYSTGGLLEAFLLGKRVRITIEEL